MTGHRAGMGRKGSLPQLHEPGDRLGVFDLRWQGLLATTLCGELAADPGQHRSKPLIGPAIRGYYRHAVSGHTH
jgi:hypothetical protein